MKRGYLDREEDVSGVSGTGKVSTFTVNDDGRTVVFWPSGHSYFNSLQEAVKTHGHNGKTRFVLLDDTETEHCYGCHKNLSHKGKSEDHPYGCPGCLAGVS